MTLRELFFSLGYKLDRNSEKNAEKSINSLKSMATRALGAIGIGFSIAGMSKLAEAAADAEALRSQFEQVFGNVEADAAKKLKVIADETGVMVNRMKGSFTQIAAFSKTTGATEAEALGIAERAMIAVADSSAFYDRSIEEVTDSMQSFLKGNFQVDAALGISCTEITRNAAANELYGKSFKDLSEAEKQLTLLKMVEDGNKLSGALGQAARESETWTNQLGNVKQSLADLKAAAGSTFLKPAVELLKIGSEFLQIVTRRINSMSGTAEAKSNVMTRKIREVWSFLKILGSKVDEVAQKFGGWENILRVIAIAGGLVASVFAFGKLQNGIKGILSLLNPVTLQIMAIVAVVLILAAILDDFINFMQGNDSVIGEIFKKAGIDADTVRQSILGAWNMIKTGLSAAWKFIKSVGENVFNGLQQFWAKHGDQIMEVLGNAWETLVTVAKTVFKILYVVIQSIFSAAKAFWDQWGSTIIQFFSDVWSTLGSLITPFLNILNGLLTFIKGVFSGDWSQVWEGIKQMFSGVIDFIVNLAAGLWNTLTNLAGNLFGSILEKIQTGFEAVKTWFQSLPEMAKQWMIDFVQGLIDGITGKITEFTDSVKGIGEKIKSFLHFSVPDEGPLTDYESWMPDFMQGLAKGIKNNMPLIQNAVKDASELLARMGIVELDGKTAMNAVGGNTKTNNVQQNNEYNIQVSGTDPQVVNNAANTIRDAGGDNTRDLADALAYGL